MTEADLQTMKSDLIRDEEIRIFPYDDATGRPLRKGDTLKGNLTIGVGHNLSAEGLPGPLVPELLDLDVAAKIGALNHALPWFPRLDPVRQRVLINVAFNCGVDGLLGFHAMLDAARVGDWDEAANELLNSQAARTLTTRYQRLARQLRTGAIE